ncbi:MAG: glycosyltransferase family 87 protein [bacterium]
MRTDSEKAKTLSARRLAVAGASVALVFLVYCRLTFRSLAGFMAALDHCPDTFCDFGRHYLPMARQVFDGTGPVEGFFYSLFFALLLVPLTRLSDGGALVTWGVLQALLAAALLAVPLTRARRPSFAVAWLYIALFFSSHAVLHNFKWGQVSVLITLCVLAALALWQRGHSVAAGFLLALATSIKLYPAWFVLVPLMRRDWRMLGSFAASCLILLVIVPVAAVGADPAFRFHVAVAEQLRSRMGLLVGDPNSQSLQGLIERLCYQPRSPWSTHLPLVGPLRWGTLAVAVGAAWTSLRRAGDDATASFLILFCALPFVTPTSWPHYFVYLPAAFLYLLTELPRRPLQRSAVLVLLVAAALLSSIFCWQALGAAAFAPTYPRLPPGLLYAYWGVPFWANALTFLALLATLPARARLPEFPRVPWGARRRPEAARR